MHNLHQIGLVCHDLINIFIRLWNFVQHALIFTAFDTVRLAHQIRQAKLTHRTPPAHFSPCPMRTRTKTLAIATPTHDIGFRPHRARDNAKLALIGTNRPLASYIDRTAKMPLTADIVVMTVYRLFGYGKAGKLCVFAL